MCHVHTTRSAYGPSRVRASASAAARTAGSDGSDDVETMRAASYATAVTTDVAHRSTSDCTARSRNARKTTTPASVLTSPVPASSCVARGSASDAADLRRGLLRCIGPDRLERHPHQRTEERHHEHRDGRGDDAFAAVVAGESMVR